MADASIWTRLWALRGLRFSRLQKFAVGLMVIGVVVALALPVMLALRQARVGNFMEVPATITAIEEKCDLLAKSFSRNDYDLVKTTSCAEADVFLSASTQDDWRSVKRSYVTLDYEASGLKQSVTLPATRFDAATLVQGATLPLFVNANRLDDVETPNTWHNILMTAIFSVSSLAMAALGWFLFRWLTPELAPDEVQDSSIE